MANQIKWAVAVTSTSVIAGTTLNACADDACKESGEIDNRTNKHQYAQFEFYTDSLTSAADAQVSLWFLQRPDGTNYEDGSLTGPVIPGRRADVIIPLRPSVTAAQRAVSSIVSLPPNSFKVLFRNQAGAALPSNDNAFLKYIAINDEVQ